MKIIGIDPGTATVGWAIIEEKKGVIIPVAYGHISTAKEKETAARLREISTDLTKIIEQYAPTEAAVEDLFFFKNVKTVIKVSQARGVILLTLEQLRVKITEYTPLQVKQAITGYGRAEKKQIQLMVQKIFKLSVLPKPDDVADALAIALCHSNSRKINKIQKN